MINNFIELRKLLKWEKPGDYYHCQLLNRKKDGEITHGNKNNSARLVTSYQFFNLQEYDAKTNEIIAICEAVGCRAGISLNIKNEETTTILALESIANRVVSKSYKGVNRTIAHINGLQKGTPEKIWLVDVDSKEDLPTIWNFFKVDEVVKHAKTQIYTIVPTYEGFHMVTSKFNSKEFMKLAADNNIDVSIHKNNPVALYYPTKKDR